MVPSIPMPDMFTRMSSRERFKSSLRWTKESVESLGLWLLGRRSRFYVLTPPFMTRQVIYDRKQRKLVHVRIRDTVDWHVIQQIFSGNDYGFEALARCEELEAHYRNLVASNKVPLILDCGANSGMATRFFKETYPCARVVAVEPDEDNLKLAKANNSGEGIEFLLAGIGSTDSRGKLIDEGKGNWAYRISTDPDGPVEIVSVNTVLARNGASSVPFIVKIDIEGFESDLFSKHTEWIDRFPVLIIELHDWMLPRTANSRNFLQQISRLDRDFVYRGENVFSISNAALSSPPH
ncbi:FkbM family methyltransferase [Variovorax ginsengisoli]|uniref:FkbM family methyltransferase n=1 Tax=Variovorax ginsengisoli TaxID=363844 RepID=A0ABT8S4I2_9BURK|nr:FkbM family methyltransferase [Variovorax ginsengisoli]MDN8614568.1 FkbM family methyltransferase [Variovorax ginsengisoli]MDO1533738.1 FkbM family methyltransferase [Variovorax ginsengisoli]